MNTKNRSLAVLGAATVVGGPAAAIAPADTPPPAAAGPDTLHAAIADAPTVRADMRGHMHDVLLRADRRLARRSGEDRRHARLWSNGRLRRDITRLTRELRSREAATTSSTSPQMSAIAACESGGDPHAVGGGGAFRGKYQFTYSSWAAVGGSGDPASAPEAEQDRRAAMLMARSGAGNWPVCAS
jgi:hypothetical protein